MKRRSLILMILIVLLPVGLLTWLGIRIARDEQSVNEQRFRSLMQQRLQDVNRVIASRFSETERRLQRITAVDQFELSILRELVRTEPLVAQVFVLSPDGSLMYPNPADALNGTELSFLQRAARMFTDRDLQSAVALAEAGTSAPGDFSPMAGDTLRSSDVNNRSDSASLPEDSAIVATGPEAEPSQTEAPFENLAKMPNENQMMSEAQRSEQSGSSDAQATSDGVTPPDDVERRNSEVSSPVRSDSPWAVSGSSSAARFSKPGDSKGDSRFPAVNGWFVWYWDRGLNLVYWQRRPSGHIVGAALERARWIADLISWLPETEGSSKTETSPYADAVSVDTSFRVVSSAAELVYEWGQAPAKDAEPFFEASLPPPLASWRLQCFIPPDQIAAGAGRTAFLGVGAGVAAFALTLTTLAWMLFRDYARDMREASQQVSFVNQVSHELKTPLTNIRLYADLLERDLDQFSPEQSEKPTRRLQIISSEAQRLSRLIGNVLTFAGQQRKTLQLQPSTVQVSELVRNIAERFEPSLNKHGIEVHIESRGSDTLWLDADFVEQILGNLISNVEKYAADGKRLTIRTTTSPSDVLLDVLDAGPGIAAAQQAHVFQPFARLSKDLRSSTGTGIGLSITRELARLHGGDALLKTSEKGCWFQIRLRSIPPLKTPEENK